MPERSARLGRLLQVMSDRERLLGEEAQRSRLICRQVEGELQALQPSPPMAPGATAAAHGHRQRYVVRVEQERVELQERLRDARAQARAGQLRVRQVAQTRRAVERLLERLTERARERRLRQEQNLTDEHAQRHALE